MGWEAPKEVVLEGRVQPGGEERLAKRARKAREEVRVFSRVQEVRVQELSGIFPCRVP